MTERVKNSTTALPWLRGVLALVATVAVPLLLAYSGLTIRLGSHPRWTMSTALIGATVGLLVALGLLAARLRRAISVLVAALAVVLAGVAAHFGKEVFVASYAENGLAGHFWYFGWIGALAGAAALVGLSLYPGQRN